MSKTVGFITEIAEVNPCDDPPCPPDCDGWHDNPKAQIKWLHEGHTWVKRWKVASSSSDKVYTVAKDAEGRWGCSCPVWIYHRKTCKHIRSVMAQGNPNQKRALITWFPGTNKYKVVVVHESGKRAVHIFKGDEALKEGLWKLSPTFFMNERKEEPFCPKTTEWVAPNPYFGHLKLKFDVPPTKKAPTRRFLHKCPPTRCGKRRTDPKGLEMLDECLKRLKQMRDMHILKTDSHSPPEYTKERQALHNIILDHIFEGVECIPEGQKPIAILTGGPPGAGKTTFVKMRFPWTDRSKVKGILHIDQDYIRGMLPEYEGWNSDATHTETQDIFKKVLERIGKPCKTDIFYDGTMNSQRKYADLITRLKDMGYFVYLIFVEINPEISRKRVKERYVRGGRYVPSEVVEEANLNAYKSFLALTNLVDGWMLVDGNERSFPVIDKGGEQLPESRPYWPLKEMLMPAEKEIRGG